MEICRKYLIFNLKETLLHSIMKKGIKYSPIIIFGVLVLLLQTGRVRFGHGLGDFVNYGFVYLGSIISIILFIATENVPPKIFQILSTLLIVFGIYLFLSMTIWRGGESSWNGKILVESEENINRHNYHSELAKNFYFPKIKNL